MAVLPMLVSAPQLLHILQTLDTLLFVLVCTTDNLGRW